MVKAFFEYFDEYFVVWSTGVNSSADRNYKTFFSQ